MRMLRFTTVAAVVLAGVAMISAQTAPVKPEMKLQVPGTLGAPVAPQSGLEGRAVAPGLQKDSQANKASQTDIEKDLKAKVEIMMKTKGKLTANGACYTMRSYQQTRESVTSDVTKASGYTTCTPSNEFQAKAAVAPQYRMQIPQTSVYRVER